MFGNQRILNFGAMAVRDIKLFAIVEKQTLVIFASLGVKVLGKVLV